MVARRGEEKEKERKGAKEAKAQKGGRGLNTVAQGHRGTERVREEEGTR